MRTLAVTIALLAATPAFADATKETVHDALKTGADAVIDAGRTVGRTTKSLVTDGGKAAAKTWKTNAHETATHARTNAHATRKAAHGG